MDFSFTDWTFPFLQIGMSVKNQNRMTNSVDPDEMAHHEPSHQDLHYLQRYLVWSSGLQGLILFNNLCFRIETSRLYHGQSSKLLIKSDHPTGQTVIFIDFHTGSKQSQNLPSVTCDLAVDKMFSFQPKGL